MFTIALGLACTGTPSPIDTTDDTSDDTATTPRPEPLAETDVLVIGAGAGGLAAGWAARERGADVILLERSATIQGSAAAHAATYWAAGTVWQADAGVTDSVELALSEWNSFTQGDASSPVVQTYVAESAGVIDWLAAQGTTFTLSSSVAQDTGTVPRGHRVEGSAPTSILADTLANELWFSTTATGLVLEGGAVVGAEITTAEGEAAWIRAASVVIATGGFTRNDALVLEALPDAAAWPSWFESHPGMDGNGLSMGRGVGAAVQNLDHIGLYAHGVEDASVGAPEVMVVLALDTSLVVDSTGRRVTDERAFGSVAMGVEYLTGGPYFALFDNVSWPNIVLAGRGFNYTDNPDGLQVTGPEYESVHAVIQAEDWGPIATAVGASEEVLSATVDTYNASVEARVDAEFGKPDVNLVAVTSPPFRMLPLVMARSKSFGGLATDERGAVLDERGQILPGLFAAGESCGFFGEPSIGYGFNGTITAAWWSGLRAGAAAAP